MKENKEKISSTEKRASSLLNGSGEEDIHGRSWTDYLSDAVITTDETFHIKKINKRAFQLFGFSFPEIKGSNLLKITNYASSVGNFEKFYTQLKEKGFWEGAALFSNKQGERMDVISSFVANRNEENNIIGYTIIIKEQLSRNNINSFFREQVKGRPYINALSEGLIVRNKEGKILLCNKAAEQILGFSKKSLSDLKELKKHWNCIREDGSPCPWELFPTFYALEEGKPQKNVVLGLVREDNNIVWLNINAHPVLHEVTNKIMGTVTSFTDVTDIRNAQEEIKRSEIKWKSVLNNSRNGIFMIDKNYRILLANDDAKRRQRTFLNAQEIEEGMTILEILPEHRRDIVKNAIDKVFNGERVQYEVAYTKTNHDDLWMMVNYGPVKNGNEEIYGVCMTVNDITEIKKHEDALVKSEERLKFALDGAGEGVWEYNYETKKSYYSLRYLQMLGYTEEEFSREELGPWYARVHPEDINTIYAFSDRYENGEIQNHSLEYRVRNKAGEYIWILDRGMLMEKKADGKPLKLIGTHKDISERKQKEESLIKAQQQFTSFMANTPTMNWIVDELNVFRYLNNSYKKSFNLTDEAIGKSIYDIFPKHISDNFIKNNWEVWNSGRAHQILEEGVGPDGSPQTYQIFKFPLEPENGIRLLGGVALDITQQNLLEQQLIDAQEKKKREIIQAIMNAQEDERKELAYELHDNVNQILSSSRLMLEVAVEKPDMSKDFVQRSLGYLQKAITELRKISHSLVPGSLHDISLDAAIEEVLQNINATEKLKISHHKQIDNPRRNIEPEIQLAILRITQEQFNNILKHAYASEAFLSLVVDQQKISLVIQDNGCGFDLATTRRGLGLNNIYNRVEYYRGTVSVITSRGKGCRLEIEIPY